MKAYKNIKTGAIINSPCIIQGSNWILYTGEETPVEKIEPEIKKVEVKDEITKKDIIQELEALGIEHNPRATKAELYELMTKGK